MNKQDMKLVARILENLPNLTPEEVQWWIDRPKELKKLLAGFRPITEQLSPHVTEFKVWKTIHLGTGLKTADDFRRAIKGEGKKIGDWANDILGKPAFTVTDAPTEVNLINVSAAELGLVNGGTRKQIYDRALQLGFKLCTPEVGPQLRLQYADQPLGEWLLVGMEPIAGSGGILRVFLVGRDEDGLWLDGDGGHPEGVWGAGVRSVFVA